MSQSPESHDPEPASPGGGWLEDRSWLAPSPYYAMLLGLTWLWISVNSFLALRFDSNAPAAWAALGPPLLFGTLALWCWFGRLFLLDLRTALSLREKFWLFLGGASFLVIPPYFVPGSGIAVSLAALNVPLLAMACRSFHFHRLFCLNLLVGMALTAGYPAMPPALLAAQGLLICVCFAVDHLAWKTEGRPPFAASTLRQTARQTVLTLAIGLGALWVSWLLFPRRGFGWFDGFSFSPAPPRAMRVSSGAPDPGELTELALYSAAVVVIGVILIVLAGWLRKRFARGRTLEIPFNLDDAVGVRRMAGEAGARRRSFDLGSPRGRIVYAYNLFLDRLAAKGLGRRGCDSPDEHAKDLARTADVAEEEAREAAQVFERAHYGEEEFTEKEAAAYRERLEQIAEEARKREEDYATYSRRRKAAPSD